MTITASDIKSILAQKHAGDIGGAEVKAGPTAAVVNGGPPRFDYWAMKPSWTAPNYTGYEIKVSRSDFLQDNKWPNYLPYCEYFYFVCPRGIIAVSELPAEAGLMYIASTGTRLFTKKKAPRRQINEPVEIFLCLLMWRRRPRVTNLEYWQAWLQQKQEAREIGYKVSNRLREKYENDVERVRIKQRWLEEEVKKYEKLAQFLGKHGLSIHDWHINEDTKALLEGHIPHKLAYPLEEAQKAIERILNIQETEHENS